MLAGKRDPYTIKRYEEEVMADDFKFGSDKSVIVALPNEVNMVKKESFRRATRESIAAAEGRGSGIRGSGVRRSGRRSGIVEEAF